MFSLEIGILLTIKKKKDVNIKINSALNINFYKLTLLKMNLEVRTNDEIFCFKKGIITFVSQRAWWSSCV